MTDHQNKKNKCQNWKYVKEAEYWWLPCNAWDTPKTLFQKQEWIANFWGNASFKKKFERETFLASRLRRDYHGGET